MTTELQARSGRRCVVCSSSERLAIEDELVTGEFSIRGIAGRFGIAPESLRRHVRTHLDLAMHDAMQAVQGVPALDVVTRLMDLADDAHDLRVYAEEKGDNRLLIQAHRAEERVLGILADKLGISKMPGSNLDQLMRESLSEAVGVIRVVARVARDHPRVGDLMAERFDQLELTQLATQVRGQADQGRTLFLETKKETS